MITEVFLIRHAESAKNLQPDLICGRNPEVPLSEVGEAQAAHLGKFLVRHAILPSEVYASPTVRARQTAKLTLQSMGLHMPIREHDDLHELSQGDWENKPVAEMYTDDVMQQLQLQGKDFSVPGGESTRDVGNRMRRWLDTEVQLDEGVYFAFTHYFAIRSLVADLCDWTDDYTASVNAGNTSITHLAYQDSWQLVEFGRMPE